jgi:lipoyl-dependent peroxiredoxin
MGTNLSVTADDEHMKPLFTATARAAGGRNGHTQTSDGSVIADLALPRALGGQRRPNTTTPEHLFASAYAASFAWALESTAERRQRDAAKTTVTCAVTLGTRHNGEFGLTIKIRVENKEIPQGELLWLMTEAYKICPYSGAIRGNIDVALEAAGG